MPLDRKLAEAQLALNLVRPQEMPRLAWEALESGLDGPNLRRLAPPVRSTWFEVEELRAAATKEMKIASITVAEAAYRLAIRRTSEILDRRLDPLFYTREFESLWIRAGCSDRLTVLGTLDDEAEIARFTGQTDAEIRKWLVRRLRESADSSSAKTT